MPRASSQSSKAVKSGFGLQEGIVKIIVAAFGIYQYVNKEGDPALTFFGHKWDYVKSDEHGEVENEDDVLSQYFLIQIVGKNKDSGELDFSKLKFRPGKASGPTDDDPEDLGVEIGTEGNTMYAESATATPFADADWIEFCKSLELKGFKPEINDQSYSPNYVGMVLKFHTENKPMRPNAQPGAKQQTKWVVDQIYVRPYELKKGVKAAGQTSTSAAAGKANGKAKAEPTTATSAQSQASSEPSTDASSEAFQAALEKLIKTPAAGTKAVSANLAQGVKLTDFQRAVANELMLVKLNGKGVPGSVSKEVISNMKQYDEAEETGWLESAAAGLVIVDRAKGEVSLVG